MPYSVDLAEIVDCGIKFSTGATLSTMHIVRIVGLLAVVATRTFGFDQNFDASLSKAFDPKESRTFSVAPGQV